MSKMKTNKSAAKRFRITGGGKVKRGKMHKRHILTKKSAKRKRQLRGSGYLDSTGDRGHVKKMMPTSF